MINYPRVPTGPYAILLVIRQMEYQCWGLPEEFYPKTKIKGVPITTPSMLGALNMEHNTGTQVTRAAKVEQITEKKGKPSTFTKYICSLN